MQRILFLVFTFCILSCKYSDNTPLNGNDLQQVETVKEIELVVSPYIEQTDINKQLIQTLSDFLKIKNDSFTENKYWLSSDFEEFVFPYYDISGIIYGGEYEEYLFYPSLMNIIQTKSPDKWILKIAFMEHNRETDKHTILSIYNIVAQKRSDEIVLSRYINYATKDWQEVKTEYLTYKITPTKKPNQEEIKEQEEEIKKLLDFFDTEPSHIRYFSCKNPKEVFEIKGFDYDPMMYVSDSGGFAEHRNIIISGNNSEIYTHEVVHLYTMRLFPDRNRFLDEGLATYIGGSGFYDYEWHRKKLKKFFDENPDFKIEEHTDNPYERIYFEIETPVLYVISALICERTIRLYGKEKLFELFKSNKDIWETLKKTGLTKENINEELKKENNLTPLLF